MKSNLFKAGKPQLIAAAALMIASFSASAEEKVTLMLDWFVNPNHGPIILAKEKGWFAEQGLEVQIQEPADPSVPDKLVAAGRIDLAVSYQSTLISSIAADLPLVRSATLISGPLNSLIVLDKSGIKSMADLKGKNIGVAIGGNEDATIGTMLRSEGVDMNSVKIINVGWALSSSLASGKVDAIWGGLRNFELNQLAIEGYDATAFYPEEHGVPPYDELIFVANKHNYNPETINKFNTAIEKATVYLINHPERAWEEFAAYSPDTLNNELNRRAWEDTLTRFALRPGAVELKRYDEYAEFMKQYDIIKTLPKAQDYVLTF
ncbi:ABC transporter substrate-binding protein [Photobacterium sp. DNB23_23_1]|uniref:ABC transporter substrate-binding protein n=1 Tax=Photobacterium pectinilyticum TaxID=2906793 RepID=A0ABT1N3M4_9GAMM|nr:ABC transporter substrate-binding protein [Photobacterium sp. ZSDE20]MCQ1059147.1 ABC transporter substrate-binding protein [Photobacterium sp. ZSDE20]MDD1824378.1 ABC transporter substrate-binding protein [Photobacterium sp. ZSDE20]